MAESADVLCAPHQQVILPDLAAGCSMADMVAPDQLETCWEELTELGLTGRDRELASIVPVTYINSAASIKAFVGERGGTVCTSSNAAATLRWAFERGNKILFLPDQHLGRNTAYKMGIPLDEMVVWDPNEIFGGVDPDALGRARMILWKGHCSVHVRFSAAQIESVRRQHPGIRVIVHPEVPWDVVQAADDSGSTEYIIKTVKDSPAGSVWAVGTEVHLVNRLAQEVAPTEPSCRSISSAACARPCSVCRRIICCGFLKSWLRAAFTTGSSCRTIRNTGQESHSIACCRFVDIRLPLRPIDEEDAWRTNFPSSRTTSPRSSPISMRRRCRFITGSIIRHTSRI
jgi:quinolinate synthase